MTCFLFLVVFPVAYSQRDTYAVILCFVGLPQDNYHWSSEVAAFI